MAVRPRTTGASRATCRASCTARTTSNLVIGGARLDRAPPFRLASSQADGPCHCRFSAERLYGAMIARPFILVAAGRAAFRGMKALRRVSTFLSSGPSGLLVGRGGELYA
ncbi:hypothetical protein SPHINGO8AM_130083 [Sphingomonas sp. 8AM]|nr:hypothetical protein SPHINGO8AM_130083 [Sphingomonas sp. 8AM]